MANQVILFDLPSKDGNLAWSLNPWKTRAALNFKGIHYKTEWVEFPDIQARLSSYAIQPNNESEDFRYTIPAIRLPDGSYVMESSLIADALEKLQPEQSLRLDNGYTARTQETVSKLLAALLTELAPPIPKVILNHASVAYYEETRAKAFGMPLSALAKSAQSGEAAWKGAKEVLAELTALLMENAGPFVEGEQASYADIIIAAFLEFARRVDIAVFDRITEYDLIIKTHYEATKPWLARNNY